ncbi:ABC transporter substrate-binding protein [Chelativorans salis]|uniref:ABC transporter substrate-binding protein n=1 Tax=Chelativorans salis TaxID=2978478 RepID=A0ABT2LI94_9HYPH|nr:ABC transporter substrate-binding protein [Chelativorans sp. EGI FJ00035]MCT7374290.1 ABC transporter substrate-binding protein [Chelativorans sp. EGI FJ00035]
MFKAMIAVACCGLAGTAAAQEQAMDIPIVFLSRTEEPRLPLSFVDPVVQDPGVWGARLAIEDNKTTGKFLGHEYELIEAIVPADGDVTVAFQEQVEAGHRLFISDLPREDLLKIAEHPDAADTLIFNGRVEDDDLRTDTCHAQVFHTALSRSMRTDALVQFLVWKRWPRIFLLSGTQDHDVAYADAIRRSAKKFGTEIVSEDTYAYSPVARRTDSGHIQIQQQMPLATQEGGEYDVLVVADESGIFGEYLPFNTFSPRPVAGTHGLVATSWHRVQEQWGSTQFQRRFTEIAGRWMEERDYGAWLGIRAIGEAVTRVGSADVDALRSYLRGEDFALGGFKGVGLSFRPWSQQMRQPVLLVNKRILVSASPQPGFLHERTPLDSLGYDMPETRCALQ